MRDWKKQIDDDPNVFAEIAKASSQCPSRAKGARAARRIQRCHCRTTAPNCVRAAGGELGFFTRGKMVKEFDTVVFNKEPGFVYGPGERSPRATPCAVVFAPSLHTSASSAAVRNPGIAETAGAVATQRCVDRLHIVRDRKRKRAGPHRHTPGHSCRHSCRHRRRNAGCDPRRRAIRVPSGHAARQAGSG
eukprot:1487681-Prymnesium_polylepis.2